MADNENINDRIKKEGDLTRNTGKNSVKALKEETANSSDKVTDRIKREGDLQRNSGTNSIKSFKETININFDKFEGVFKKIDKNIAKQTGLTTSMIRQNKEAMEDQKQGEQYEKIAEDKPTENSGSSVKEKSEKSGKNVDMQSILGFLGLGGLLGAGIGGAARMLGAGGIMYMLRGPISDFVTGAVDKLLDSASELVDSWNFDKSHELIQKVGNWFKGAISGILSEDNKESFSEGLGTFFGWYMVGRMFSKRFALLLGSVMLSKDLLPIQNETVKTVVAAVGGIVALFVPKIIGAVMKKVFKGLLAAATGGALWNGLSGGDTDVDKKTKTKGKGKGLNRLKNAANGAKGLAGWGFAALMNKKVLSFAKGATLPALAMMGGIAMNEAKGSEIQENAAQFMPYSQYQEENPNATPEQYVKDNWSQHPFVLKPGTGLTEEQIEKIQERASPGYVEKPSKAEQTRQDLTNKFKEPTTTFLAVPDKGSIEKATSELESYFKNVNQEIVSAAKSASRTEQVIEKSEKASSAPSNVMVRGGDNHVQGGSTSQVTNINNYHSSDKASQLDGRLIPFGN